MSIAAPDTTAVEPALPVPDLEDERRLRLADLLEETSPATRRTRVEAATRPALPALAPVLPDSRLPRGVAVEVVDDHYLLGAMAAGPAAEAATVWTAAISMPTLGLAAARAYGLPLERLLLVDTPGERWSEITSVLAGACEVVLLDPPVPPRPRELQRLEARLRAAGTTLLTTTPWTGAALRLTAGNATWSGLGDGHGMLRSRTVDVRCTGRGRAARLLLPDENGSASTVRTADAAGTPPGRRRRPWRPPPGSSGSLAGLRARCGSGGTEAAAVGRNVTR
ncbi:hypothetical protein AB0I39_28070 [Kitasatospora purpeofusca]|uniref:hypothetical protein n=1 Tax=Kitasatospora purpeofusca TaxID=67352 RepID=UPI0033FD8E5D